LSVPKGGEPNITLQKTGMWCIIVSIGCEYLFLIVNVYFIIKTILKKRKDPEAAKKDELEEFMIYKWVRKSHLKEHHESNFETVSKMDKLKI
jgi:hypothetical protein